MVIRYGSYRAFWGDVNMHGKSEECHSSPKWFHTFLYYIGTRLFLVLTILNKLGSCLPNNSCETVTLAIYNDLLCLTDAKN